MNEQQSSNKCKPNKRVKNLNNKKVTILFIVSALLFFSSFRPPGANEKNRPINIKLTHFPCSTRNPDPVWAQSTVL